jgi:hypothetical protein
MSVCSLGRALAIGGRHPSKDVVVVLIIVYHRDGFNDSTAGVEKLV